MNVNGETKKPTLGETFKALRLKKRYTLREVEKITGINNGYLSQLERDKMHPSFRTVKALCAFYEIGIETL